MACDVSSRRHVIAFISSFKLQIHVPVGMATSLLRLAVYRAADALDYEDQVEEECDPSLRSLAFIRSIEGYQAAVKYMETALSFGTFCVLKQNALFNCIETYKRRINSLQIQPETCFKDDKAMVGREWHKPVAPQSEDYQLLETTLSTCLKEVKVQWSDIAGMDLVKDTIVEGFLIPLRYPELFNGIQSPVANILLYGWPGTGKTLLAEAIASETRFKLLSVSPSAILSKWCGESERMIKGVFDLAKRLCPCIILLDEIDSFGLRRACGGDMSSRRVLSEILMQMNQIQEEDKVYIVGATNRLQDLDEALTRRFDLRIEVPVPDYNTRKKIVEFYVPKANGGLTETELGYICDKTEGYSGSDLKALTRIAALRPIKELVQSLKTDMSQSKVMSAEQKMRRLSLSDFQHALKHYKPIGAM